jgi:hypothetical protein
MRYWQMTSACRLGVLALALAAVSCGENMQLPTPPTVVTVPTSPPPAPPAPNPTPFPGAGVYVFSPSPGVPIVPSTLTSRYVLNSDGTFALQYQSSSPFQSSFEFRGRFREAEGRLIFDFDWNGQQSGATAVFSGDSMTVTYNEMMSMSDFENGVFIRTP